MKHYDVAIIGGGLVGTGLAVALQQAITAGLKVALVDARHVSQDDPRLFALNDASCRFLQNLGLWDELAMHASPIHQVHVSQQGKFGAVRLNREEVSVSALGHVIPAKYVEQVLNERVEGCCDFYRPAKLVERTSDNHFMLDTGQTFSASIIIAADGTNSTVRELLNIPTTTHDYHQRAIVTRISLHRSHQQIAYERFTADGAIAMLPLTNNECAMIWSADTAHAEQLMALSDELFLQALQAAFGYRLGRLVKVQQRHQFPLRMLQAEKTVVGNTILIGNAAHTLHPIAAQGFNLALKEVAVLADLIAENYQRDGNLQLVDLTLVAKATKQHGDQISGISHRLSTMFSNQSMVKSILLQLGMLAFETVTPVKQKFIEGMMGKIGITSRLLLRANET